MTEARKAFFFEKKKQKTFVPESAAAVPLQNQRGR